MKATTRYLAYTGILLALAIIFQSLHLLLPMLSKLKIYGALNLSILLMGSLIHLTIVVAVWKVGFFSGLLLAFSTSAISVLQGLSSLPVLILILGVGITALAATVKFFPRPQWLSLTVGAIVKSVLMYALVILFVIPAFVPDLKQAESLKFLFSWPQFLMGVLGGSLALFISPYLTTETLR